MGVEKIIEKAVIEFPRSLKIDEAENLIKYISKRVNSPIKYNYSICKYKTAYSGNVIISEKEKTGNLTGAIVPSDDFNNLGHISFFLRTPNEESSEFSIFYWGICPSKLLELRNAAAEAVKKYFEENRR